MKTALKYGTSFLLLLFFSFTKIEKPLSGVLINGKTSYTFYGTQASDNHLNGGGTITATPGTVVTVTDLVGGSGSYGLAFYLSGATFTYNSSSPSTTVLTANTTQTGQSQNTATFIMPSTGYVSWSGTYYGNPLPANTVGTISVH